MHRNNMVHITEDLSPAIILRTGAIVVAVGAAFAGWLLSNAYVEWAVLWEGQVRVVCMGGGGGFHARMPS